MMISSHELIVDNFAGGGGASLGIEMALGRSPDIAINHDPEAIAMHKANHPNTRHYCKSIYHVDPDDVMREYRRPIGLAWFSPDCTHHSKARGGKPKEKHIRDLAWVVVMWAERAIYEGRRPRVIIVENVEEFQDWGPLLEDGQPCPVQKGKEFKRWVQALRSLGYKVEWQELRACDYGAPTSRKRLFIIARCDGLPIVWPDPTNGTGLLPYRTAAECIDFTLPCPSIFDRKRPLVPNTMRRIAHGVRRYVIEAAEPFIINITHGSDGERRVEPIHEPLRTITGASRGEKAICIPTLIQTGYGERKGQKPRVPGLHKPLGTIVGGGQKHALVAAFLAQHNTGMVGHKVDKPLSTLTERCTQQQLVTSHLIKLKGTCKDGQDVRRPMPTVQAQGLHVGEVRAFLLKYHGTDQNPDMRKPMSTITAKHRLGLVEVHGATYRIGDIGMRMLTPPELYKGQGFTDDYIIDPIYKGKPLTKTAQVRMCGNSVSPPNAAAVAAAQFIPAPASSLLLRA